MSEWKMYRKKNLQEMRPYVPGEDLSGVSVNAEDTPEEGGMIARNSKNHKDQWYVAKEFFEQNYEEIGLRPIQAKPTAEDIAEMDAMADPTEYPEGLQCPWCKRPLTITPLR